MTDTLALAQINSQPRVDGAKSEDPAFGWGPINGYVYQKVRSFCFPSQCLSDSDMHSPPPEKAYLEVFCPPQHVEELLEILNDNPSITYHAVNKQGDFRSNTAPGPNAVTWGVFPGAEVIQPTVVDSAAFQAWKDEAYELGSQWAQLYQETSPETQKLIHSVFDEYHLGELVAAVPLFCNSPPSRPVRTHFTHARSARFRSQHRLQRLPRSGRRRRLQAVL